MSELTIGEPIDGVICVELNRPPANLWTVELCSRVIDVLESPPAEANILRLRARGAVFCLGRERQGSSPGELREEAGVLAGLHRALRRSRLVSIAEVHGDAAGFGVGVLAGCDVAVAAADARFSFPEVTIGLAPAVVLAWLPALVGERVAFWLTATGESIDAEQARQLRLVNAVAPSVEELAADVDRRIRQLCMHNPRVHAEIKQMLHLMGPLTPEQALDVSVDRLVVGSLRRAES